MQEHRAGRGGRRRGAHALSGGSGAVELPGGIGGIINPVAIPPDSPGGDAAELAIDDLVRSLAPELGLLRGGGGGGGGGSHLQGTQVNGLQLIDCAFAVPEGSPLQIQLLAHHSSAGGGGGGGAFQLQAGSRAILNGTIRANGGDGGSAIFPGLAQSGGGGAGGGVLLQGPEVQIQPVPSRINVRGGGGGLGAQDSLSGDGGPGLIRVETEAPVPDAADLGGFVVPSVDELRDAYDDDTIELGDFFTTGTWAPPAEGPSGVSGAQSCWIRPDGNFFRLVFEEDGAEPGWDMTLRVTAFPPQSFRGTNEVLPPGTTLESVLGSDLETSPVIVRFQGARALGTLVDPCQVPVIGADSPLVAGSLTEWVAHPSELSRLPRRPVADSEHLPVRRDMEPRGYRGGHDPRTRGHLDPRHARLSGGVTRVGRPSARLVRAR